jgi:catechol 2,3-dioxygenase-like lactoylglutathione lyase family enzyme
MATTQIQLVSVPVSDQDRARSFYEEALGFETLSDLPLGPHTRWVQMRPPGAESSVALVTWFTTMPPGSLRGLVVGSDDLDGDVGRLAAYGVDLGDGIRHEPWGSFVAFADPDGNGLVLQALRTPSPDLPVGPGRGSRAGA